MTPRENYIATAYGEKAEYVPLFSAGGAVAGALPRNFVQPLRGGTDIFGVPWVPKPEGAMPQPGFRLFEEIGDWKKHVVFPDLDLIDFKALAEKEAAMFPPFDRNEKFTICVFSDGLWGRMVDFMGFENALVSLMDDPDECINFSEAFADFYIKFLHKIIDAYHPDVMMYADDMATASSLFMSPDTFRTIFKPFEDRLAEEITKGGAIPSRHCCGQCEMLVPDFIDSGFRVWSSAQPTNDIAGLLDAYKGKIAIEGGWDTIGEASYLNSTEEQVRKETIRCMTEYKKPGFILCAPILTERGPATLVGDPRNAYIEDEWMKYRNF